MKTFKPSAVKHLILCIVILSFFGSSCKKDWLNQKPDSKVLVLTTLQDYKGLLNNTSFHAFLSPNIIGEYATDNLITADLVLQLFSESEKQFYIWGPDKASPPTESPEWVSNYSRIYQCNVVIDGLSRIERTPANAKEWDQLMGSALYFRAVQYYSLCQIYTKPYDANTAATDLGVPLRVVLNISKLEDRGTVQLVYNQVIEDLTKATQLLFNGPQPFPQSFEPTQAAAFAMLARTYLTMGDYEKAKTNSNLALDRQGALLDYNKIPPTSNYKITMPKWYENPEVISYSYISAGSVARMMIPGYYSIDKNLYDEYLDGDLRKKLYFETTTNLSGYTFCGSYDGTNNSFFFAGPAVDEMYLIRAECSARLNDAGTSFGLNDLNTLLRNRWEASKFIPYAASNSQDALDIILKERRKELVTRGLRWTDLRRLNKESRYAVTIARKTIDGQTYTLTPNSNLYVWQIPLSEISISGIQQNPR